MAISTSISTLRRRVDTLRDRARETLAGQVWERMLEIEFVDRSIALAGKAFVSFFPLVIVVAAFMPPRVRTSILSTLTNRLGITGDALTLAKESFRSTQDIRQATGLLGLALTIVFATSFTTALQRTYLRAWRRPRGVNVGAYTRGPTWLLAFLSYMAVMGAVRGLLGDGLGTVLFLAVALASTVAWWWFTAWFLLLGHVRWRVLLPGAVIAGLAQSSYAFSASVWMPNVVERNNAQFGFFGVALALVTWFSGAAICVILGACAGAVLAEDPGSIGQIVRGGHPQLLTDGAAPSLPAPDRELRLRDAFRPTDDELD